MKLFFTFVCVWSVWGLSFTDHLALKRMNASEPRRMIHDGPDPLGHWIMNSRHITGLQLKARLGPNAHFSEPPQLNAAPGDGPSTSNDESVQFKGRQICRLADDLSSVRCYLPTRDLTVEAWVGVDAGQPWGGIIGVLQDNGGAERGWILGHDEHTFYFGLSSQGADDGDGKLTYLKATTAYQPGVIYHVVGVYDGQQMQIFVNGNLEAQSTEQSGEILYPESAPVVMGAYQDSDEFNPLRGRLKEIALYELAAKDTWVAERFQKHSRPATQSRRAEGGTLKFLVNPFLQFGTEDGMTVVWETSMESKGTLCWGPDANCEHRIESESAGMIHQVRIETLQPDTQYFYRVEASSGSESLKSEPSTFQTACNSKRPITFAVISDTQDNPPVANKIATLAWQQRPQFVIHAGDLVGMGSKKSDWVDEFFASMQPLISRVPMYSVLGNHEENAHHYFDYMALPKPEYYYSFVYGNAEFFMIDSNRNVDPDSEQYLWLDQALQKSNATWKFVAHHHPPFSSDEDDYGELWKTNVGTRGDERIRQLVTLYEKHQVDIVWAGHIHSYERTWPLRDKRSVEVGGTIYMITGGGGGSLETPGPYRPYFQNVVRRGHHYVMIHINGRTLELRSYDLDDRLFDTVKIEK